MFSNVSFHNDPCQLLCGCGNVVACAFTPVDRLLCSKTGIKRITILLFILGAVRFHMAKFLNGPTFLIQITCSHWSKFHGFFSMIPLIAVICQDGLSTFLKCTYCEMKRRALILNGEGI